VEIVVRTRRVFRRFVAKISDQFLEQGINIKFCVKLGKNSSDTCVVLSEATLRKSQAFLSVINDSKRAFMSKSQMKNILITFFDITDIVHFEFFPQGQTVKQTYYVEVLKQLREAVRRKRLEFWPNDWILRHDNAPANKALSVMQLLVQKSITEMKNPPDPLIWLRMNSDYF
jgi:hypothetical protein